MKHRISTRWARWPKNFIKATGWMQDFLRVNPFGRIAGRTRLFTEADIITIIEALPRAKARKLRHARSVGD